MTEQEAIEIVKKEKAYMDSHAGRAQSEAFEMSIKALEEVQKLRNEMWELNQICRDYTSLGTVEEFKALKEIDYDCSIKHLTGECSYNETGCSDCIGREKIRKALEKQIAKKPVKRSFIVPYEGINVCPSCKEPLPSSKEHHCKCGQKLDLVNEDEE